MHFIIYTDGGARGNPGPGAAAFVVYSSTESTEDKKKVFSDAIYLGNATNNIAEYSGVIAAFKWLLANDAINPADTTVEFFLDSLLVVMQLSGHYKVRSESLKSLTITIKAFESSFKSVTYRHIPRAQNALADKLVNDCLDSNR